MQKEMVKRIHRMANITWDVIGGDILTLMEETGEGNVLTRDEVIEAVSDASYMMYHGNDKKAYEAWNALPTWEEKQKILKDAFPHKKYGW
jgi:hypothetical protein